MDHKKFKDKHGPEYKVQAKFIEYLQCRNWRVERMIGNALQMGIPDIFIMHEKHGTRWVDLKAPGKYEFTRAQIHKWPLWEAKKVGIWIIRAATDEEYDKLFHPPNMREYWKDRYDEAKQELEETMQELFDEYNLS
jgi:hypothetical protein